jgi:hypothetical protein
MSITHYKQNNFQNIITQYKTQIGINYLFSEIYILFMKINQKQIAFNEYILSNNKKL